MNIFFCGNFGQLSLVSNSALYIFSTASKALIAVIAGKMAYNAFTETVVLTEIMHQQYNLLSVCQFYEVLNQLQDGSLLQENWQFLLSRTGENLNTKVCTKFNSACISIPPESKLLHTLCNAWSSWKSRC